MKNKISTLAGLGIIVILSITIAFYTLNYYKLIQETDSSNLNIESSKQVVNTVRQPTFEKTPVDFDVDSISKEWKEISSESYWDRNENFPNEPCSPLPIKFSYPSNWNFFSCEGLDYNLRHSVSPVPNSNNQWYDNAPSFSITEVGLVGCKEEQRECSREETVPLTSKEVHKRATKYLPEGAKILSKKYLEGLGKYAFSYTHHISRDGKSTSYETHIIELEGHVIQFQYRGPELLDSKTKNHFLDSIQFDR